MTAAKVADLTIDEFRALVQEIVVQTLSEMLGDPDEGAELREDFAEELSAALAAGTLRKQDIEQAVEHVLKKNEELYRRLS